MIQKYIPIQLQSHYDGDALTTCLLARIKVKDGRLFAATDLDVDVIYDPSDYDPGGTGDDWGLLTHTAGNGGFSFARLETAGDLSVDNTELGMIPGDETVREAQMLAGIFDLAEVRIYRVNYMDLSQGHECVATGQLGNVRISENISAIEYRSLTDLLKQPETDLYSIACPHIFGKSPECPKAYAWTEGTVTNVDGDESLRIFADTDLSPADNFYVPGVVEWLSGDNAGVQMDVEQNTAGTFALALPMGFEIKIGNTFRVRQDCSKVYEDGNRGCLYHWAADRNIYFGGFPDIPVSDGGASQVPGAQLYAD